jgi:hypothetical protein
METKSAQKTLSASHPAYAQAGVFKTLLACIAGAFVPGLGHAMLGKWDRAIVFFACISTFLALGLWLGGRLFNPDFGNLFAALKFLADAGLGLLYWIPWQQGAGNGDPTAYTYDYANVFIYVGGLLNMIIVIDVFDIAMGRKK